MADTTLASVAQSLIAKRDELHPELALIQARVNGTADKVVSFLEEVKDEGGWDWAEEWEYAFLYQLDEYGLRVLLENVGEEAITFTSEYDDGAWILRYADIEAIDQIIAAARSEWAAQKAEGDEEAAAERAYRKRELLAKLAQIEAEEREADLRAQTN